MDDFSQVIVLNPQRAIEILNIRSLVYYKIQGFLQQSFESLHSIFEGYNNFKNEKQEEKKRVQICISLVRTRRKIIDRQIFESTSI